MKVVCYESPTGMTHLGWGEILDYEISFTFCGCEVTEQWTIFHNRRKWKTASRKCKHCQKGE